MKTLLILLMTLTTTCLIGQKAVTWIGGTPGKECQWNEPKNWSDHKVPNEFSNVIIGTKGNGSRYYPEIKSGVIELNALDITSNAKLKINDSAKLIIYDSANGLFAANINTGGTIIVMGDTFENKAKEIVSSK